MSQSLATWIESRNPPAPAELRVHLMQHVDVGEAGHSPPTCDVPEALVTSAERALHRVLASGGATRETALDLLSADAFVTYAFEAAADNPASVFDRADHAMRQVSARAMTYLDQKAQ